MRKCKIAVLMTTALAAGIPAAQAQMASQDAGYPLAAQGWGGKTGADTWMSRYVEDWTALRDPAKRTGVFDGLKYIPFNDSGDTYLSVSMEQRFRGDYYSAIGLREGAASQSLWLYRAFLGADLHVGEHVRAFTELAHGGYDGRNVTSFPASQRDDAFLQQAFVDLTGKWGVAEVGVRVGRQDFQDGPQWLVTTRENSNTRVTFDGVRAWAIGADRRLDVFDYRYVDQRGGYFDDGTLSSKRFSGALAGFRLAGTGLYLEPFWFHARDDNKAWGGKVARETRDYFGMHFYGTHGALTFDTAAMYQTGDFGERDLRAYSAYSTFNWKLSGIGWAPQVGFHADLSSGGGAYGSGTLRNSSILFGSGPYHSWATWFGSTNYIAFAPMFQFAPSRTTSVQLQYQRMWRQSTDDAIYSGAGTAYAGTQRTDGRRIGDLLRLNATWKVSRYVAFTARAERFLAAAAMEDAGYGDATFFGGFMTFRF
ncbi:alginate export family protein [Pseudoxanthomonas winnipegensis]|jgi:hypothetical protein|nr:alginate export family protein [Pseudoxanthomonas winnipegensis]